MRKFCTRPILAVLMVAAALPGPARAFSGFAGGEEATQYPEASNGVATPRPAITAHRLNNEEIRLDGKLDDPAWKEAEPGSGFRVSDPDRGATPTEQTIFKVAYDEDALYFGVACLERDPSKIEAKLSRRDRSSSSDLVSVYIDPYFDHTTGYNFKVNPLGVQQDSYIYNDGERDDDWDAVWEAKTYRDEHGWYAEVRIPYSAIRYRAAPSMTWGLQIYRYMHGRGEDTAWVIWDREAKGFVSRFGELRGIEGVRAPRQVEIVPYVVQSTTDPAAVPRDESYRNLENFGADLKYGVTADLTLNATANPDFGQVEADPAVLNLSPFETFYDEKRPFFIEGSRFFQSTQYNLFYSRRIGTGAENARIRYAAKLTGKTVGGVSVAALAASTDITGEGQAQNIFKDGQRLSRYFVGRVGKDFGGGRHHVNVMQTAAVKTAGREQYGDRASREAYTTGVDFDFATGKRIYGLRGSFVGSAIDPEAIPGDSTVSGAERYGTGGWLQLARLSGRWQGNLGGAWKTGRLDLNDLGYLESADQKEVYGWVQRQFNPEGKSRFLNRGNLNLNFSRSWLWDGRMGRDAQTGAVAWSYGPGHPRFINSNVNGWMQLRSYWEVWGGAAYNAWGSQRYETRGGPLISEPATYGGWLGFGTDSRKNLNVWLEGTWYVDQARNRSNNLDLTVNWSQSSSLSHSVEVEFHDNLDDTQYLETVDLASRPGGIGIGGRSYVFGKINQKTVDLTLRSNILFSRTQSLELYAQPFVTVGTYAEARELLRADSYDLVHYNEPGYDSHDFDFRYAAFNWNAVYRWEYRPGSTLFLVWTQSREGFNRRDFDPTNPSSFQNPISLSAPFSTEAENRFLAKITYWFAL
jgi:Domain of unknown function (DUF5916)/Carbohydrate family 9 binding domain-like